MKNALITKWVPESPKQKERELKLQIDKLIESARVALEKQTDIIEGISLKKTNSDKKNLKLTELKEENQETTIQRMQKIEEVIARAAAKMAHEIGASCVISVESEKELKSSIDSNNFLVKVSIYRRLYDRSYEKVEYRTKMRKVMSGSIVPIKEILAEAIHKKYINKGDRVVCVEDESLGMGFKGLLFIFDVDKIFFNISTMNLGTEISPEVLEAVINIGIELGKEGREGRKVGTAFIIGNREKLSAFTKQLIINPFSGYPEEQRKIIDPNMRETVKEFAQLDGVFILGDDGTVLSAGTHLNVNTNEIDMPGYGTRHRCSAALTKHVENSLAVVVSESGGVTSVFKNGNLILKLP